MTNAFARLDAIPDGLLTIPTKHIVDILPRPTLIDLPGRNGVPLFVTVLLHGNEDTGLLAIQQILHRYRNRPLPRRLLLFIGNVEAAAAGVRTLPSQLDFNRAWPGTIAPSAPESEMMRALVDHIARLKPFASIDIHNNTGRNPHYACLNRLDDHYFHLARLFSRTVVYFEQPVGVQSAAMAELCPAVTVECGHVGERSATDHAAEFIEACLSMQGFPAHAPRPADFDLLRTFATVKVPSDLSFSFDGSEADIRFREDIDHLNFSEAQPGTLFGYVTKQDGKQLNVTADHPSAAEDYFDYGNSRIQLARPAVPAMLTRDPNAVRLDCLCYLMHRIGFDGAPVTTSSNPDAWSPEIAKPQ